MSKVTAQVWPIGPLDPDGAEPLYLQIESDLRRIIQSGVVSPDLPLPSELELSAAYKVGRHTVRMALSRLVADDLIVRHVGRGTFIKPHQWRAQFYLDRSFTRQMAEMGLEAHSKVLVMSKGTVDHSMPDHFLPYVGQHYLHLARLRLGGGEPVALQSSRVLLSRCPDLDDFDFNRRSLYDVLATEYRLIISQIDHTISANVADEFQAGLLQIARDSPLLVITTTALLEDQQLIEETTTYYRADKYEYRTTQRYQPAPAEDSATPGGRHGILGSSPHLSAKAMRRPVAVRRGGAGS